MEEIQNTAEAAVSNLLPPKSKDVYMGQYNKFMLWCSKKNVNCYDETVLLAYFFEESKRVSPATLWSHYSMLKSTLAIKNMVDISKYFKLIAFLKRKNEGYRPKKAKVFDKEELNLFLNEARDEEFLLMKVVTVMGIAGACRRDELMKLSVDCIQDLGSAFIVNVSDTKTNVDRTFTIANKLNYLEIVRKYMKLRPACDHNRFFVNYVGGKCTKQAVGINKIGKIPSRIAAYLNLPDPAAYTGHSFRRTSATLLVDAGGDITTLKRHGGWKSTKVAEGYIENSVQNKIDIAKKILGEASNSGGEPENEKENDSSTGHTNISNCNNCIINIKL